MAEQGDWPEWWDWELALGPHVQRRMIDRHFTETDLREMLADAAEFRPDVEPGRWFALTRWHREDWKVILEPDPDTRRLVVVTAYRVQ